MRDDILPKCPKCGSRNLLYPLSQGRPEDAYIKCKDCGYEWYAPEFDGSVRRSSVLDITLLDIFNLLDWTITIFFTKLRYGDETLDRLVETIISKYQGSEEEKRELRKRIELLRRVVDNLIDELDEMLEWYGVKGRDSHEVSVE